MELRAKLGVREGGEESGSDRRERVLYEVGMGGRGNFAICARAGAGEKAVVLRLGRRYAKTCRHTFGSEWMEMES